MACNCDTECPGAGDCTCLEFIGPITMCLCTCQPGPITLPPMLLEDAEVNLSVRDNEVGAVAEFVQRITEVEVLVPASSLRDRVTLELEGVKFPDAMKELGLVLASAEPEGSAY